MLNDNEISCMTLIYVNLLQDEYIPLLPSEFGVLNCVIHEI